VRERGREKEREREREREVLFDARDFYFSHFTLLLESFLSLAMSRIIQSYRSRPPEFLLHAY